MIPRLLSTLLLQPTIVPSSVANNSTAGPDAAPELITKPLVALVATPVGDDVPPLGAVTITESGTVEAIARPVPSNACMMPVPFPATQSPLLSPNAIPHG